MVFRETTKKAKSSKARTAKVKAKTKIKAKPKYKTKPKTGSAKSSKKTTKKRITKAKLSQAKQTRSFRTSAKPKATQTISTGAGAKLASKVGSALPVTKEVLTKQAKRKGSILSPRELEEFKALLLQRRRELLDSVSQMRDEALKQNRQDAAGNLSKFPSSPADLGSDNYELEFTLSLLEEERNLLKEIDEAIKRIDQGVYGICEATGEPIARDRLLFEPWARYTVEYASRLEKGLIPATLEDESEGLEK